MHPLTSLRSFLALVLLSFFLLFGASSARAENPAPPAATQTPPAAPAPPPAATSEKPAARREDVEPSTLTDAKTLLAAARAERDKAEADAKAAEDLLATAASERDTATASAATLTTQLATANTARDQAAAESKSFASAISAALQFTPAEVTAFAADTAKTISACLERVAGKRAVEIAAGQGTHPVPAITAPKGGEAEAVDAFALANAEPDPTKRAQMFKAAAKKLVSGNN